MQKIQILFPEPQMRRLKEVAKREDRSISDIVRRATDSWLDRQPSEPTRRAPARVPTFRGGEVLLPADGLRDVALSDRLDGPSRR